VVSLEQTVRYDSQTFLPDSPGSHGSHQFSGTLWGGRTRILVLVCVVLSMLVAAAGRCLALTAERVAPIAQDGKAQVTLHDAARLGDLEGVKRLLESGAKVNAKDWRRRTPLHWAAWKAPVEVVQLLLQKGASVNPKDDAGWTPIHVAVKGGNLEAVKLLIEHRADVRIKNGQGDAPLNIAVNLSSQDVFHRADIARVLIEKGGADVNGRGQFGLAPLDLAGFGDLDVARLLIEKGADVNTRSKLGFTPLHNSASPEMTKLLLENGAEINARTKSGNTPLFYADQSSMAFPSPEREKYQEMAKLLRERGATL